MSRTHRVALPVGLVLTVAALGLAQAAGALTVVDYDAAVDEFQSATNADFQRVPYTEDGTTTLVDRGHYEILADPGGSSASERVFSVDEQTAQPPATELSKVTLYVDGPRFFDAVSLEVVNPAEDPGEYTITGIGGSGGSIPAPTTAGTHALGFSGIVALVITQHAPGAFAIDNVTVEPLPEPASLPALLAGALALAGLQRRRAA